MRLYVAEGYGGDVWWTPSGDHSIRRIGPKAYQIRERRADGSPFGDLLDVVATKKAAREWFAANGIAP